MLSTKKENDIIYILICGNEKAFNGMANLVQTLGSRTKATVNIQVMTMDLTEVNPEYSPITDSQLDCLNGLLTKYNSKSKLEKKDVTELYKTEFLNCPNQDAYCTPYTLIRLLADKVLDQNVNKILYLDAMDVMLNGDFSELYNIDMGNNEIAGVTNFCSKDKEYLNAGVLLLNMDQIRKDRTLEMARSLIKKGKLQFADQDAINKSATKKMILARKYNEQAWYNHNDSSAVIHHFCQFSLWGPPPIFR